MAGGTALLADVGGTNARFGVLRDGRIDQRKTLRCVAYPSLAEAALHYMSELEERPKQGALAVACPVTGDRVRMTNHVWSFSIEETRRQLGLRRLEVINDFSALALALPDLDGDDLAVIREGEPVADAPIGLLGPGTGLGVSGLVWHKGRPVPLATEGGHRDLAVTNEREWEVYRRLQERFGRVSAERAVSGPGLVNLNAAIFELEGRSGAPHEPRDVVLAARAGDEASVEALELFISWLAAVASDLALTLGARGGVFIGGGVVPRLGKLFDRQRFEERFLDKGRFRPYLEPIPVTLVRRTEIALQGVARLFS